MVGAEAEEKGRLRSCLVEHGEQAAHALARAAQGVDVDLEDDAGQGIRTSPTARALRLAGSRGALDQRPRFDDLRAVRLEDSAQRGLHGDDGLPAELVDRRRDLPVSYTHL